MKFLHIIFESKFGMWVISAISIICLSVAFQTKIAYIYEIGYFFRFMLAGIIIFIAFLMFVYEIGGIIKADKKRSLKTALSIFIAKHIRFLKLGLLFAAPYILIGIYTALLYIFKISKYIYIGRSISSVCGMLITILCALSVIYIFKKNAFKIAFPSMALSYATQVILSFNVYGVECIKQIYNSIFTDNDKAFNIFEVHDLTFACGILLLFFIYIKKRVKIKINMFAVLFPLVFIVIGYKRIQFLALAIMLLYIVIVKCLEQYFHIQRKKIYTFTGIGVICISLLFILIIDTGTLSKLCETFGINTHDRIHFYEWSNQYFDFSPAFLGIGSGAITKLMSLYNPWGIYFDVSSLHSDILRTYIDIGFIGLILVEIYYLLYIYKFLCRRVNESVGNCYFIIQLYLFILHFTDNTFTYFATQCILIIVTCYMALFYDDITKENALKVLINPKQDKLYNDFSVQKTAAVISIYDAGNYGNRLQNYAVKIILEKKNILVINYKNVVGRGMVRRLKSFILDFRPVQKAAALIFRKDKYGTKYQKGCDFSEKYNEPLPFYIATDAFKLPDCDYYIVGSDQVWNPEFKRLSSLDLLSGVSGGRKIALSASFGISVLNTEYKERLRREIAEFDYLSVREASGLDIINEVSDKPAITLIDPTMMLTAAEWSHIEKPVPIPEAGYILTYFLGSVSDKRIADINSFAAQNGVKVIHLGNKRFKEYYNAGPDEFIYLIHHADYICTDSYHACVFSIIYEKPFFVFERIEEKIGDMTTRIICLLEQSGINMTLIKEDALDTALWKYDYRSINENVLALQKKFDDFLNLALS